MGGEEAGSVTLGQYLRQLVRHQNFLWFVGMDLVQVFHCHFNSNFFPLFLEHLLSDHISLSTGSFLLGKYCPGPAARTCCPQVCSPQVEVSGPHFSQE